MLVFEGRSHCAGLVQAHVWKACRKGWLVFISVPSSVKNVISCWSAEWVEEGDKKAAQVLPADFVLFSYNNNTDCYDYVLYTWEFVGILSTIHVISNFIFYRELCPLSETENLGGANTYGSKEEGMWPHVTVVNAVLWVRVSVTNGPYTLSPVRFASFRLSFKSSILRSDQSKSGKTQVHIIGKDIFCSYTN